jgi:hypothetical protein
MRLMRVMLRALKKYPSFLSILSLELLGTRAYNTSLGIVA